jgi:hypothetical protein
VTVQRICDLEWRGESNGLALKLDQERHAKTLRSGTPINTKTPHARAAYSGAAEFSCIEIRMHGACYKTRLLLRGLLMRSKRVLEGVVMLK